MSHEVVSLAFGRGVALAIFHKSRKAPCLKDPLNKYVTLRAICTAANLVPLAGTPSDPAALVGFKPIRALYTSSLLSNRNCKVESLPFTASNNGARDSELLSLSGYFYFSIKTEGAMLVKWEFMTNKFVNLAGHTRRCGKKNYRQMYGKL